MSYDYPDFGFSRLEWYDRNPINRRQVYFAQSVGPHVLTQRWTYTVPAGKKAWLEAVVVRVERSTITANPGRVRAMIQFTGAGGVGQPLLEVDILTGNVGDRDELALGFCGFLNTGDTLEGYTADFSVGGFCDFLVTAKITEFDT